MIDAPAIAAALSAETNQPWGAAVELGMPPTLTGPGGAALLLREHEGRIGISGAFGPARNWRPRDAGADRISVAATAAPDRIAREVSRRLLPSYLAALTAARTAYEQNEARVAAAQRVLTELLELAGGRRAQYTSDLEGYCHPGAVYRIKVSPRDEGPTVQIELRSLDVETARAVVAMLAGRGTCD